MTTESIIAIVASCTGVLSTLISGVCSYMILREDIKERHKTKRDNTRNKLAYQVIGFFYEETVMAEEIARNTGETPKQVKMRMRKLAEKHPDNKEQCYPNMTAQEARDYIKE